MKRKLADMERALSIYLDRAAPLRYTQNFQQGSNDAQADGGQKALSKNQQQTATEQEPSVPYERLDVDEKRMIRACIEQ